MTLKGFIHCEYVRKMANSIQNKQVVWYNKQATSTRHHLCIQYLGI